ncbi:hypothetical protein FRB95_003072 [Tulasnella sp. JGI-2019a]|nr:hypothetical protein FRB93_006718 [Tulasnella sp. JGI-2019a]KAG9031168.1 hypothetical protein FRB95_003072 [Tulasnella sp. JGI-2019a]
MLDVSNPASLEDLEFWGRPNDDVSRFLGAIMRAAVIQGRHSDKQWMFAYTESCLRGDAMEWFDNMSPDVARMEWSSLRKAFLRRFHRPASDMASLSPAAIATVVGEMATTAVQKAEAAEAAATEAAATTAITTKNAEAVMASATKAAEAATIAAAMKAVVAAATKAAVAAAKEIVSSTSRCRVKVVIFNGQTLGYISAPDQSSGWVDVVSSENALVLNIPQACYIKQTLARIRMVVSLFG